jgi:hypothetical protein
MTTNVTTNRNDALFIGMLRDDRNVLRRKSLLANMTDAALPSEEREW